jgi:YHS domain-containing protein
MSSHTSSYAVAIGQIVSLINLSKGRTNRKGVFILSSFHTLCANTIYVYQEMEARPNRSGSPACLSLSRNRQTYWRRVLGIKCVFQFFTLHILLESFFVPINILRITIKMCVDRNVGFHVDYPGLSYQFSQLECAGKFNKLPNNKFHYSPSVSYQVPADEQTEGWTDRKGNRG